MAAHNPITIQQGRTFNRVLRWEAPPINYKPITAILNSAPVRITAAAHGLPDDWRTAVVSVKGMTEINAESNNLRDKDYHAATVVDPNTVEINDINAAGFKTYTGGGYLQFNTPVDLTGFTARMTIRDKIGGIELLSLTTENGGITIDNATKKITLLIEADDTAALTWIRGVYDLEMVSSTGVVTALLYGEVSVKREVTA